jgi:acyl-CoA synthetase (AMP-forming)/AMP-acid ligase II
MEKDNSRLYELSTGKPVTSLVDFTSPTDEYRAAFENREQLFLNYYTFPEGQVIQRRLTRGEFWNLACSAAACLNEYGLTKGNRLVHTFSANSLYDLVFRLAAVLTGCVPVTINWQADDNERILYKTKSTEAKLVIYDDGFAHRIEEIKPNLPGISFLNTREIEGHKATDRVTYPSLSYEDERMIIFTSGTTGKPKGVSSSHRSYLANRLTFEQYFGLAEATRQLDLLITNPLHHSNSSALSDWGMRRGGTVIHLLQRYTTAYWEILVAAARSKRDLLVAPMVSRHIDFLDSLVTEARLPVKLDEITEALSQTEILIGSAPVGPTTINRILQFCHHLPNVRFGSTETCLQVMATPRTMPQEELMKAFEAGWSHRYKGETTAGYYIGREHYPFTRVKVVKSTESSNKDYMSPCKIGEPGYLITQGANIMNYYVGEEEATRAAFKDGWYTNLGDIVFALENAGDGELDYYWLSRDSSLLIRGGANYAYDQVAAELSRFVEEHFHLSPEQFQLAVVGLRLESEHEDSCCVTIELKEEAASAEPRLKADFVKKAAEVVSKGTRPDYVRFAPIPRNFKGAILYPELRKEWLDYWKITHGALSLPQSKQGTK